MSGYVGDLTEGGGALFSPPVYIQVPFCPERCDYCAIPVSASPHLIPGYLEALKREIGRVRPSLEGRPPLAVYVGGGSPTSLPDDDFARLLEMIAPLSAGTRELTFESRPEALVPEKIALLKTLPSLRLSLGMEALDAGGLLALGRSAPFADPLTLLHRLGKVLDASLSMDFICTGRDFSVSRFLDLARRLYREGLDHLSVYPLVIEERTVSALRKAQNRTQEDLEETAGENWREVCRGLSGAGWIRYEVSNFSREENGACLYNLHVWKGGDYLGLGTGAHQKRNRIRTENVRSIHDYVRISGERNEHPYEVKEKISSYDSDVEFLYTNLRLREGLPLDWLLSRTEKSSVVRMIDRIVREGGADRGRTEEGVLVLSEKGLFMQDEIARSLLDCFKQSRILN